MRPRRESILPAYLAWWLNQPDVQAEINAVSGGTGINYLRRQAVERLGVMVPGLGRQQRVVEINRLWRLEKLIESRLDTTRFASQRLERNPGAQIIEREVGTRSPATVNEEWIAAAFADPQPEPPSKVLRESEQLIEEIRRADLIVLGAPIYNFGMPAQLKAYFNQVGRIGRTVAFDPDAAESYRPLLEDKPVVIIVSAGDGAMHPGGELWHMSHLEPHLKTVLGFIGLTDLHFIRAGYDEFQDDRAKRSLLGAERTVDEMVATLCKKDSAYLASSA